VRSVLDKQVQDRLIMREKQLKEKQDFDRRILDQARFELELEEKKRKEKEQQLLKNRLMRD